MKSTATVDRVKSFIDKKDRYILQTTKNRMLFAKEHKHTFYELVYVLVGHCTHRVCGQVLEMEMGDFIILRPFDTHAFLSADSETDILCISLSVEEYRKYELLYGSLASPKDRRPHVFALPARVRETLLRFLAENEYTDNVIRVICSVLFSGYADQVGESEREMPRPLAGMMEKMSLDLSLQREGVDAMVRLSGYSVSQLSRLMKRYYGVTPHEYLKDLRLATARRLIAQTDISLESISFECGYHCYGYFTDIFREKYGMTPAMLRKNKA